MGEMYLWWHLLEWDMETFCGDEMFHTLIWWFVDACGNPTSCTLERLLTRLYVGYPRGKIQVTGV